MFYNANTGDTYQQGSAAQFIPVITPKTKQLTQIVRSAHWLLPRLDTSSALNGPKAKSIYQRSSLALNTFRLFVYSIMEMDWLALKTGKTGDKLRKKQASDSIAHVKKYAPEKYWDLLIPDFDVGCKVCGIFHPLTQLQKQHHFCHHHTSHMSRLDFRRLVLYNCQLIPIPDSDVYTTR